MAAGGVQKVRRAYDPQHRCASVRVLRPLDTLPRRAGHRRLLGRARESVPITRADTPCEKDMFQQGMILEQNLMRMTA